MNSLGRRFAWGDWDRRKLYIVPRWSCNIYRIWRNKVGGEGFKVIMYGGANHKGGGTLFLLRADPSRHDVACTKVSGLPRNTFYGIKA